MALKDTKERILVGIKNRLSPNNEGLIIVKDFASEICYGETYVRHIMGLLMADGIIIRRGNNRWGTYIKISK